MRSFESWRERNRFNPQLLDEEDSLRDIYYEIFFSGMEEAASLFEDREGGALEPTLSIFSAGRVIRDRKQEIEKPLEER